MLGAIYIGLTGLNAFSDGLKTISNNVANMNTAGFKATNVTFSDLYNAGGGNGLTFQDAGNLSSGGGVALGAPTIDFSQGTLSASSNDLDLAINGSGFFVLLNGSNTYYTRTGQFVVGTDGYIVEQNTQNRLGVLDANGNVVAFNVDGKRTSAPVATTTVTFANNLSSDATTDSVSNIAVYDSRGGKHVWTVAFTKLTATSTSTNSSWTVTVTDDTGAAVGTSTLKFIGNTVDPSTQKLVINATPSGADPLAVTLDFSSGVTSYAAGTTSTLRISKVDGQAAGSLTTVTVDSSGKLKLSYSNSASDTPASIALADFRDPQSLVSAGNGLYTFHGKGEECVTSSGTDNLGSIVSKQIEASNVNLSDEFGQLILIQRGFQASSQVVSVSNDMIQQLFGIRGQGG